MFGPLPDVLIVILFLADVALFYMFISARIELVQEKEEKVAILEELKRLAEERRKSATPPRKPNDPF